VGLGDSPPARPDGEAIRQARGFGE
jgi:hypothetical protein